MSKPLLVILMGSGSDLAHCQKISESAQAFGLETALRIGSAHRTPQHLLDMLAAYEADPRPKVYITVAGRSNALSGFVDGVVSDPVIACPPSSSRFGGADIFSSLRMPSGIAPAVVLEPENAALLAAKILGLVTPEVLEKVKEYKLQQKKKVIDDDASQSA